VRRIRNSFVFAGVACALVVSLGVAAWGIGASSSDAQAGTMHNCPVAGNWSIAVWEGESAEPTDALATCGAGAVAAAYSLDPQTGAWSRWFAGKPNVSNMSPLNPVHGVLALGSATAPTPTPTPSTSVTPFVTATPAATPTPTATTGAPQSGHFRGTTSQGNPIEFDVAAGSETITRIKFQADGTCGDGCTCEGDVETNFGVTPPTIANNAFSHSVADYDISGTFTSTTAASGSLEYHHNGVAPGDADCNSGPITWEASLQI
jgi:hypothetical protein